MCSYYVFLYFFVGIVNSQHFNYNQQQSKQPSGFNQQSKFGGFTSQSTLGKSNYNTQSASPRISSFGQQSAFGQQPKSSFGQQSAFGQAKTSFGQQSSFGQNSRSSSFGQQPSKFTSTFGQQSAFGRAGNQKSPINCKERNVRYPVSGSCDKYIECLEGEGKEVQCPDGLLFNPNALITTYPCQFPNEVQCEPKATVQSAQPTELCPHQYGYFRLGDERNCTFFRTCVEGRAYDIACPEGLAFDQESYLCDWPDQVKECDAEGFLGFACPQVPTSRELGTPGGYRSYSSSYDCQRFFTCIDNRPRLQKCGYGRAFDDVTESCQPLVEVTSCPAELRAQFRDVKLEEE